MPRLLPGLLASITLAGRQLCLAVCPAQRVKKYCRPQMMAFADHAEIAQCMTELNQTAEKLGVQYF